MKRVGCLLGKLGTAAVILIGCDGGGEADSNIKYPQDSAAIALVKKLNVKAGYFKTAPFRGGVAVVTDDIGVYWVYKTKAYAVNGAGLNAADSIEYAPPAIEYQGVVEAVKKYHNTGQIDSRPMFTERTLYLDKILRVGTTTINEKKAATLYLGGDEERFCEVTWNDEVGDGNQTFTAYNPNINTSCSSDGKYYVIVYEQGNSFSFSANYTDKIFKLSGTYTESGGSGDVLKVDSDELIKNNK